MTFTPNANANEFQPEQVLGGRYRVISLLGRGGMGVVYKVEQIYLGLELALKTINQHSLTDASVRRFQAEARAVFALNHPNVISVHDFGLLDDQTPFLAMEIVEGETLSALLKQRVLTIDEAIPIFIQVCHGLAHAHEQGIVHRDIKPGNIMLLSQLPIGTEGSVKVLDFGIAKFTEHQEGEIQALTRTGEIFGSPLYMSPEQCGGGKIDHRSDIYSLGCVIFEALTGTTPFVGESALSTMMMHQSATIPSLKEASLGTEFPKELEQVVQSMLAKDPNNRYQNLSQAAHDLAATGRGEVLPYNPSAQSKPTGPAPELKSKTITMRRRMLYALIFGNLFFSAALGTTTMKFLITSQKARTIVQNPDTPQIVPQTDHRQDFLERVKTGKCSFSERITTTDESLSVFEKYDGVQLLKLDTCMVTDKGLAPLKKSHVLELMLSDCNITAVDNIAGLDYLQTLNLRGTYITDSALAKLAKLKMLRVLTLRDCKNITDEGLKQLIPSTSLRDVVLSQKQFSKKVIAELSEKMPQCCFEGYTTENEVQKILGKKNGAELYQANQQALAMAEQINPNLSVIASCLRAMSLIRSSQKDYTQAEALVARARTLLENNGNKAELADALTQSAQLALLQNHLGEFDAYADKAAKMSMDTMLHDSPELMVRLEALTFHPPDSKLFENAIKNSKSAIAFIQQQSPSGADDFLPFFTERVGWYYFMQQKYPQALPYLKENVRLCRNYKEKDPMSFARALIELGHCEPDQKSKRQNYEEGLDQMDAMGHQLKGDLLEHYCDGCTGMVNLLDDEKNQAEALRYARRGLAVANLIRNDIHSRKSHFQKMIDKHQ